VKVRTVTIPYLVGNSPQSSGGKVKPLKAPKKEKKEMDEDEVAFKAKQQAGTYT
jgi:hypothetical protein